MFFLYAAVLCFPPRLCSSFYLLAFAVCYSVLHGLAEGLNKPRAGNTSCHSGCDGNLLESSEEIQPLHLWCTSNLALPEEGCGGGVVSQQCGPG